MPKSILTHRMQHTARRMPIGSADAGAAAGTVSHPTGYQVDLPRASARQTAARPTCKLRHAAVKIATIKHKEKIPNDLNKGMNNLSKVRMMRGAISATCAEHGDEDRRDVDGQLELEELGHAVVHVAPPPASSSHRSEHHAPIELRHHDSCGRRAHTSAGGVHAGASARRAAGGGGGGGGGGPGGSKRGTGNIRR